MALRAWEDREACLATPREITGARTFVGERFARAAPLASLGILHVGFEAPDAYKAEQLRLLSLLSARPCWPWRSWSARMEHLLGLALLEVEWPARASCD